MNAQYIGIDTSCYTTSAACAENGSIVSDRRTMLRVASGERGLRQSDGVFQHVRNLGEIMPALMADADRAKIKAVAVSTRPRPEQDSYMPVFLAGKTAAITLANALDVRLIELSHQQGHVRAALYGNEQLMGRRFLGMHISGGTTEIFTVGSNLEIGLIGGCADLHAGQLVDRVGVSLGMAFPSGKHMEVLASERSGDPAVRQDGCRLARLRAGHGNFRRLPRWMHSARCGRRRGSEKLPWHGSGHPYRYLRS